LADAIGHRLTVFDELRHLRAHEQPHAVLAEACLERDPTGQ
jgi:hypothetical protein